MNSKFKAEISKKGFWRKKVPVAYTILIFVFTTAATYLITKEVDSNSLSQLQNEKSQNAVYQVKRQNGFKFIRPLLSANPISEYEGYSEIKQKVSDLILKYQDDGIISSASFYLRDFDKSNWTAANPDERYSPGSMLKIPVLMAVLKYQENHPGFLEEIVKNNFKFVTKVPLKQSIVDQQIIYGKSYSRRELLKYMIEYSDNNAAQLLLHDLDINLIKKMFEEYDLPKPEFATGNNPLSVIESSVFLEALFNSTYLKPEQSEYATELLTKSTFTDGIVKGIPDSKLLIAHKFGESGTEEYRELHETAILFIHDKPYLITIMTRGKERVEYSKLESVIQGISREIFNGLTSKFSS